MAWKTVAQRSSDPGCCNRNRSDAEAGISAGSHRCTRRCKSCEIPSCEIPIALCQGKGACAEHQKHARMGVRRYLSASMGSRGGVGCTCITLTATGAVNNGAMTLTSGVGGYLMAARVIPCTCTAFAADRDTNRGLLSRGYEFEIASSTRARDCAFT